MILLTNLGQWLCDRHENGDTPWCEHIQNFIEEGTDAVEYHLGSKLEVPIFPSKGIYVPVVIDTVPVVARSAMWRIEYQPDVGNLRKIEMGLWNPGEGMLSMRTVVVDWIKSQLDPKERLTEGEFKTKCPNNAHSLRSSRLMSEHCNEPGWKWECLWNIVMERSCTPCIQEADGSVDDNFGLDDSVIPKPRWSSNA